jgi:hypothetical protein
VVGCGNCPTAAYCTPITIPIILQMLTLFIALALY